MRLSFTLAMVSAIALGTEVTQYSYPSSSTQYTPPNNFSYQNTNTQRTYGSSSSSSAGGSGSYGGYGAAANQSTGFVQPSPYGTQQLQNYATTSQTAYPQAYNAQQTYFQFNAPRTQQFYFQHNSQNDQLYGYSEVPSTPRD